MGKHSLCVVDREAMFNEGNEKELKDRYLLHNQPVILCSL